MKLKPCPFCGSDDLETGDNGYGYYTVYCRKCGASRTWYQGVIPAQKGWNTRHYNTKRCEEALQALKVIYTWATFEDGRDLNPEHIAKLCGQVLWKEEK